MCAHAVQVAADTQVDELISQLSHLTQPEATGSDGQNEEGSQTENLIAQVQSQTRPSALQHMLSRITSLGRQLPPGTSYCIASSAHDASSCWGPAAWHALNELSC